jgi:soluble lytic murein transglycosylase-like protein
MTSWRLLPSRAAGRTVRALPTSVLLCAVLVCALPSAALGQPGGASRSAGPSGPTSTAGTSTEAARAEAADAAARVLALTQRLRTADRAYATAVGSVGRSVADSVLADTAADAAADRADAAALAQARSARALYMGGGSAGVLSTLLQAQNARDLTLRVLAVRQAMTELRAATGTARAAATRSAAAARRSAADATASVVVADDLGRRARAVDELLDEAQGTLERLSRRARHLAEAERAARALATARAEAAASRQAALSGVRAAVPPSGYLALYRSAAATCPGLRWTLLAAVGQVESGHGRDVGPSSAGAVGPMQFMPATFRGYAVDGDGDGRTDPLAPADSVFTAARYLCASGAGSTSGVRGALLRYNHAQWYVDLVLRVEQQLVLSQSSP